MHFHPRLETRFHTWHLYILFFLCCGHILHAILFKFLTDRFSFGYIAAKEREKAMKATNKQVQGVSNATASGVQSRAAPPIGTAKKAAVSDKKLGGSTLSKKMAIDQQTLDMFSLNIVDPEREELNDETLPKMSLARDKIIEDARLQVEGKDVKKGVSLVVIGV